MSSPEEAPVREMAATTARRTAAFDAIITAMGEPAGPVETVNDEQDARQIEASTYTFLVVAFHADAPLTPQSQHWLTDEVNAVTIVRDLEHPGYRPDGTETAKRLGLPPEAAAGATLGLPDSRVSQPHATLRRHQGRWGIENQSRFGMLVNGKPVAAPSS